jgi:hypothetical protein
MGRHPDCVLPPDQCQVYPAPGSLWPSVLEQFGCSTCGRNWQEQRNAGVNRAFVVIDSSAPVNIDVPYAVQEFDTITCTMGNWSGEPTAYSYQWLQDGAALDDGTDSNAYAVTPDNVGHTVTCVVTASNDYGATQAPPSNDVEVVTPTPAGARAASNKRSHHKSPTK